MRPVTAVTGQSRFGVPGTLKGLPGERAPEL
jgi:hypothetical protein